MPNLKVTGERSKSCLSNDSKTTEVDFTILHGRIEHNAKVFRAQELGFFYELRIFHANRTTKCLRNQGRTKGEGWTTAN